MRSYFGQTLYDQLTEGFLKQSSTYKDSMNLTEWHMYGSSRLGIYQTKLNMAYRSVKIENGVTTQVSTTSISYASYSYFPTERGAKRYELTNHLGNVLVVVSDKKIPICSSNVVTFYKADVVSATDYSAFGAPLAERSWQASEYRFGFNGQVRDDEVAGVGNINTAEFWEYDARLGRRWNLDPIKDIDFSDYSAFGCNPILFFDKNGDSKQSRHLDKKGNIIAEYNDGDNSVYKHQTARTKKDVDYWRTKFNNTSGNGVSIGQMSGIGLGVFDLFTFMQPNHLYGSYTLGQMQDWLNKSAKNGGVRQLNSKGRVHLTSDKVDVSFDKGADNPVSADAAMYFSKIMEKASEQGITSINISSTTNHPSNSKRSAHSSLNGARAFDMNEINGIHVSLNNEYSDILQKIIKTTPGWRENYGPLIIQKLDKGNVILATWAREIPGGHFDHVHVSTPH